MSAVSAPAWTWILEHSESIDRLSAQRALAIGLDPEDVRQSATLRLVEKHDRYDPQRSSPGTWIWWTVREVTQTARRKAVPVSFEDFDGDRFESGASSLEDRSEARSVLEEIGRLATEDQTLALLSLAEGWSGTEVRERLGLSLPARNARIYRLRDRYLSETALRRA